MMKAHSFIAFFFIIIALSTAADSADCNDGAGSENTDRQDDDLPNDPYMNYLLFPHFHFTGTFRADGYTGNNKNSNYDNKNFDQFDILETRSNWNPKGSGEWTVSGSVTRACYANGHCVGNDGEDNANEPILAAPILEGGDKTSAKIVDLDTEVELYYSEIWGWRIRIGNLFSGDYTPVPLQYLWNKKIVKQRGYTGSTAFGVAYQSVLSNIKWIDNENDSPFVQQLQRAMNQSNISSEELSIRFNLDMYETNSSRNTFTTGRITGTVGLLGQKSPPFFTHGRVLKTLSSHLQDAPFYVDETKGKVFIDFGNSLPIDESAQLDAGVLGDLLVAVPKNTNPSLNCSDDLLWLGLINYKLPNWYQNTAGVQVFPSLGTFPSRDMDTINTKPLVVAKVSGTFPVLHCKEIVLAEDKDGIEVHPYSNWAFRKDAGENTTVKIFATKFGKPLSDHHTPLKLEVCDVNCNRYIEDGPLIGQPPLPKFQNIQNFDQHGIATFNIPTKDPENNRSFIDGQLYLFRYLFNHQTLPACLDMCVQDPYKLLDSLIVIRVFDSYTVDGDPTWLDHVHPIFQQYANLYPVMTEYFVDLGNYYEVINYRHRIQVCLELPESHPNYMPVTRDLSKAKREVILKWLNQTHPLVGNPKSLYTVEHVLEDLQIALQLEHSTLPPYMTAWASIKKSYNQQVKSILRDIIIQEMMHAALVANIINALGGKPSFYSKDFIPRYPSGLPGGVHPDLVVPIEKISLALIRNIFMKIEQPEFELQDRIGHVWEYVERTRPSHCQTNENGESCTKESTNYLDMKDACLHPSDREESASGAKDHHAKAMERSRQMMASKKKNKQLPGEDSKQIVQHHNTIGNFYHHILTVLGNLTNCGADNTIFRAGNKSKQVVTLWSLDKHNISVYDYHTAVDAIQTIIEQGEGSDPCNPIAWDEFEKKDLSHYYLLQTVVEERGIQVVKAKDDSTINTTTAAANTSGSMTCNGSYYFNGSDISFDPEGIWPMIPNPRLSDYTPGSKAYRQAVLFNKAYTKLLKSLDVTFNGHPEALEDAIGLMYAVELHLKYLLETPVDDNGDPDIGPNAGPTFDFTP